VCRVFVKEFQAGMIGDFGGYYKVGILRCRLKVDGSILVFVSIACTYTLPSDLFG